MGIVGLLLGLEIFRRLRAKDAEAWIPGPTKPLPDTVFACGMALVLYVVALFAIGGWLGSREGPPSQLVGLFTSAGLHLVFALALFQSARHAPGVGARRTRLATAGVWMGLGTFGVVHIVGIGLILLYTALGHEVPTQDVVSTVRDAEGVELALAGVAAVVVAPFAEEVFFRGILLPAFARYVPAGLAVVVQALIFGVFHFLGDLERLPLALPLTIVGLLAGWLYVRTRSLLAVTLLHAVFNGVQFALLLASR